MKTLHFTNSWHEMAGGIETFYRALFRRAESDGHQMCLVVPGEKTWIEEVSDSGRVYHITAPRAPFNPRYRILYPHRFLFPQSIVHGILNEFEPDIVEVSEKYTAPYLAGLLRTRRLPGVRHRPVVIGLSHERMDDNVAAYLTRSPVGVRFCRHYMKWLYFPMFDHHITVSEHTAKELIEASHGHKVKRGIWIAPMGVDCQVFHPSRRSVEARNYLLQQTGAGENATVLLYAGRLAPEKNLRLLLDTMARLSHEQNVYCLAIAGAGIERELLQRECGQRSLKHVVFLGHISKRETLAACFASSDIFVHPNPGEPFGIAPLEAMASGLPLVAPESGGLCSYANPSNAWLAAANGPSFAACIRDVHASQSLRCSKIAAARETAERFDWSSVTGRYFQLYREISALTRGIQAMPALPPHTYSTPGDAFGRELMEL